MNLQGKRMTALSLYGAGVVGHLILVFALRQKAHELVTVWIPGVVLTAVTYGVIFYLGALLNQYPVDVMGQSTNASRLKIMGRKKQLIQLCVAVFLVHMIVWPISHRLLEWTGRILFLLCTGVIVWLFLKLKLVIRLTSNNKRYA